MTRRPRSVSILGLIAKPKRLHPRRGWYWQVSQQGRGGEHLASLYGTREQVEAEVARLAQLQPSPTEPEPSRPADVETVRDLLEVWLGEGVEARVEAGSLRQSSLDVYDSASKHVTRLLGDVRIERLESARLDEYARIRRREGAAIRTVQREHQAVLAAWAWGQPLGLTPARHLRPTRLVAPETGRHVPSPAEVAAVLPHLPPWVRMTVVLQHSTGARVGEALAIRVRDVTDQTVRIPRGKTGAREVPVGPHLAPRVAAYLAEHRAGAGPDDLVVRDRIPANGAGYVSICLRRACKAAEVPSFTSHGLRYGVVRDLLDAGVDPRTACELTGHSLQVMLAVYRRTSSATKRDAVLRARIGWLPEAPGQVIAIGDRRAAVGTAVGTTADPYAKPQGKPTNEKK